MNPLEIRTTFAIASIFALRMLGLFMILPVFALYSSHYVGSTPQLVGLVYGAYGLTQALLQIPLGSLSDRIGRKPVILGGLILFSLGSIVAATASSIFTLILGRAVQGAGAVGGALLALLSDLTRPEQRTKSMAIVGTLIGVSFSLAIVLGPIFDHWFGLAGIFWSTALFGLLGISMLFFIIPSDDRGSAKRHSGGISRLIIDNLKDRRLTGLYFAVFSIHAMLTASFTSLPIILTDVAGLSAGQHWQFYLPILVLALLLMVPFLMMTEKFRQSRLALSLTMLILSISELSIGVAHQQTWAIAIAFLFFLSAFSLLEALLPSLISKLASPESRGTAMGIQSTVQFLGIFAGGLIAGSLHRFFGLYSVFIFNSLLAFACFLTCSRGTQLTPHPGIASPQNP